MEQMKVKQLLKAIESLQEHYSKEAIDNMEIGYEIIDGEDELAVAPIVEIAVEKITWENETTLTLVLSEFTEETDTKENVLGYPINLN
jgi:hypothetical protein